MGPPGPTGTTGIIRPCRLGWSCKSNGPSWIWTAMVACRGALHPLLKEYIVYHNVASVYTINDMHTRVYVSYVYIYILYTVYTFMHTWNCILETLQTSDIFWLNSWLTVLSPRYDGFSIGIAWQWTCHNLIYNCFVRGCTNPLVMQWWSLTRYTCPSEITRYQLYTFTWGETTQLLLLRAQKIV